MTIFDFGLMSVGIIVAYVGACLLWGEWKAERTLRTPERDEVRKDLSERRDCKCR
jgi:hypothetical protein